MRQSILALLVIVCACEEIPRTYSTLGGQGRVLYEDDFDRAELGPRYNPTAEVQRIEDGRLRLENGHNHPVWLDIALPEDVKIEFDAWALSDQGDIKVEFAGDGKSFAQSASYTATGYVVIFGGLNNKLNVIARQDEHGKDRRTRRGPKVEPDRRYHFEIIRRSGEIRWLLDGKQILTFDDEKPLRGTGHHYFAFNGWEAPTQFDNLKITALTAQSAPDKAVTPPP